jgi:hypothetical protein
MDGETFQSRLSKTLFEESTATSFIFNLVILFTFCNNKNLSILFV